MARNYVEFYLGRINQAGNFVSFADRTQAGCEQQLTDYVNNFGGTIDIHASKAYFLVDKVNIIGLIRTFAIHYGALWGSSWSFLQNGLIAHSSPRGKGRKKWSQIAS